MGSSITMLEAFQQAQIDWMYACGGKGRCTTCKAIVLDGAKNLTPLTTAENKYSEQGALGSSERLSCQAKIIGDVCIVVPDEYKLPHIKYND
jgi:2Fe-2S ferredoxin